MSGGKRVLVIDNYDSFTYNLVQYLGELGAEIEVVRNDKAEVGELLERGADRLVVSPGPCTPAEAGISVEAIRRFAEAGTPVLGVCLGHQSLVEAFGGRTVQGEPIHGKDAEIEHDGKAIYAGLPSPMVAGRYHSLVADPDLPGELELSATLGEIVMGARHRELPAEGVQFHPGVGADSAGQAPARQLPRRALMPPNDVVTRAIDAVCAGDHLTADHASAVLAEIMEGRTDHVQTGAFLIALRAKGETVPELVGLARTMRSLAIPVETSRDRPRRYGGHRWRPLDLQRLDHGGPDRRRRGLRGRQARQPLQLAHAAPPNCWRRSASTSSSTPSRSAAASTSSASASCSRPATTPRWPTSSRFAKSSVCGRSSTSSVR